MDGNMETRWMCMQCVKDVKKREERNYIISAYVTSVHSISLKVQSFSSQFQTFVLRSAVRIPPSPNCSPSRCAIERMQVHEPTSISSSRIGNSYFKILQEQIFISFISSTALPFLARWQDLLPSFFLALKVGIGKSQDGINVFNFFSISCEETQNFASVLISIFFIRSRYCRSRVSESCEKSIVAIQVLSSQVSQVSFLVSAQVPMSISPVANGSSVPECQILIFLLVSSC